MKSRASEFGWPAKRKVGLPFSVLNCGNHKEYKNGTLQNGILNEYCQYLWNL